MVKSIDWDDVAVMTRVWGYAADAAVGSRFENKVRARTLFLAPKGALFSRSRTATPKDALRDPRRGALPRLNRPRDHQYQGSTTSRSCADRST
jgi:hypothetical protein